MAEFFNKWKQALNRSSKAAFGRLATVFGATEIDSSTWEELEALLIQADLGIATTGEIIAALKKQVDQDGITSAQELTGVLRSELLSLLDPLPVLDFNGSKPAVILIVGVNGSGKTTTIAKLGRQFAQQGQKVLLAAADTFRAAAVDQLQVWADRLDLPRTARRTAARHRANFLIVAARSIAARRRAVHAYLPRRRRACRARLVSRACHVRRRCALCLRHGQLSSGARHGAIVHRAWA